MDDLFRRIFSHNPHIPRVFIEHVHEGTIHRHKTTACLPDLISLKREILDLYSEILIPKIADVTNLTQEAIENFRHPEIIGKAMNLFRKHSSGRRMPITDIYDIRRSMTVIVEVKQPKETNGQGIPKGPYRIWCPIHSKGQGYLQIGARVGDEPGLNIVDNSGTTANGTLITLIKKETDPLTPDQYYIHLNDEHSKYYLQCEEHDVFAREFQDEVETLPWKTSFHIVQHNSTSSYYRIECMSNNNSMLRIAGSDTLVAAPKVAKKFMQYLDPAYLFFLCIVDPGTSQTC